MLEVIPAKHERLLIYRRREKLTIVQFAYQLRISDMQYRRWEAGEVKDIIDIDVGELSDIEKCVVLRKRHGLTQAVVAQRMGIHVIGVVRMEAGLIPVTDLVKFWRKNLSDQAN